MDFVDCKLCVNFAIKNDTTPIDPAHTSNAVQLCKNNEKNIQRIVENVLPYLKREEIMIRVKSLRFLKYLAANGPETTLTILKQYTQEIGNCTEMSKNFHPVLGNAPIEELRNLKEELYEMMFSQLSSKTVSNVGNGATFIPSGRVYESVCSDGFEAQSLDSVSLNQKESILTAVKNKIMRKDKKKDGSTYGSVNSQGQFQSGTGIVSAQVNLPQTYYDSSSARSIINLSEGHKSHHVQPQNSSSHASTPVEAFLIPKIKSNPTPSRNEINDLRSKIEPQSLYEIADGIKNSDFKVKYRAIYAFSIYGEKYGFPPVAQYRDDIFKLTNSPEKILKDEAKKLFEKIKNIAPSAAPSVSQFKFD